MSGNNFHVEGAPGLSQLETQRRAVDGWFLWQEPACSTVRVSNLGVQHTPAEAGDGRNTIQWVSDWTSRGFEPTAAGVTDVQYEHVEGMWAIVEADIYLNAQHFTWRGDDGGDITGVIAHEMGHVLGLLHPCEPDGNEGAPLCGDLPEVDGTTMHPLYDPDRATLSPDDAAGICFLYPRARCVETGCPEGYVCAEDGCQGMRDQACGPENRSPGGRCLDGPSGCPASADCAQEGRGASSFGDPCGSGADCRSGVCADDGICSAVCSTNSDCTALRAVCREALCVSELRGLSAACTGSDECLGGECLRIDGRRASCTRPCQVDAQCSMGWTCQAIEDRQVCARRSPSSRGCSVPAGGFGHSFLSLETMGLVA